MLAGLRKWLMALLGAGILVLSFAATLKATEQPLQPFDREAAVTAAGAVTRAVYPDADEVLVDCLVQTQYHADGTAVTNDETVVKILTEQGMRNNRELTLSFTVPFSEISVPLLEVIKPNGTAVAVDVQAQGREMISSSQMGMNIYDPNDKDLAINIPGLEVGDLLHYRIERREVRVRIPNTWNDFSVVEYTSPIRHYQIEVLAPAALPLRHHLIRDEIPGTVTYTAIDQPDGGILHRWEIAAVPRTFAEPDMPELYSVAQRILVSTITDWEWVSKWYWQLSLSHLEATTPEMKAKVAALIAGEPDRRRQIEQIFYWVAQNIRYMGITTETCAPGYEPHDVSVTFAHQYGVCRDKAALLVAMLRLAGFDAYPVLIMNGPKKDLAVPNPYFNHAITAVREADGSYLLMDATDEKTRSLLPAYLDDCSYLVAHPQGETLRISPITTAEQNLMRITTRAELSGNGSLLAESELHFDGINDGNYRNWLARLQPEECRQAFEQVVKQVSPGAELLDLTIVPENLADTATPLQLRLRYLAPQILIRGSREVMLPLPWLGTRIGMVNFVLGRAGLEKRKYPLKTGLACGVEEQLELRLGNAAVGQLLDLPDYQPINLPKVRWSRQLAMKDRTLVGSNTFLLQGVEFTPAEYLELKQVLRDLEFNQRQRPLFAAAAAMPDGRYGPDVDAVTLEDSVVIELDRPDTWREVRKIRRRLLTYAGTKTYGEIKLQFNPAWQEAKLRSAQVTMADGTVQVLRPEELNLMDAPWVGGAPRYPAERILVASLPGIAIGSVVEYEVERTSRDQPFFALTEYLQGFDPIEQKTVTVRNPHRWSLLVREPGATVARRCDDAELTWSVTAVAPLASEPALPPGWLFVPQVTISAGDWASYAATLRQALPTPNSSWWHCWGGSAAPAGQTVAAAKAAELIVGQKDDRAKVRSLRDFVARNIREAGPGLAQLPRSAIAPADLTLQDGYGNTTDRAVLLAAMLAAVGFQPEFVLLGEAPDLPQVVEQLRDQPQAQFFNQVLVRIELDGQPVLLNDADQYAELGALAGEGMLGLNLNDGSLIPVLAPAEHRSQQLTRWDLALAADGTAAIAIASEFRGMLLAQTRQQYANYSPEERLRHFQELVAQVSQSAVAVGDLVTELDGQSGRISFCVKVPRFAVRDGNRLLLNLPGGPGVLPGVGTDQRHQPLWWTASVQEHKEYQIRFPDASWRPVIMPEAQDWTLPGNSRIEVQVTQPQPTTLIVTQKLTWHPGLIGADAYGWLLEINRRLTHPQQRTILLEQTSGQ